MDRDDQQWLDGRRLNVIGHELRTPVSTIRGLAEVLAATPDADARQELIDALVRNARRLEGLVDDLLAASGITTVLPTGAPVTVDVAALVRAAWGDGCVRVAEGDGRPVLARVRRASLDRIIRALLENAAAYGEAPGSVEICRTDGSSGATVRLTVDSPGPALPPEDVRFALEPFWRGERAVTSAPGMGLGLAVARALCEHEGGRIWVEARPGGGLITVVELAAA